MTDHALERAMERFGIVMTHAECDRLARDCIQIGDGASVAFWRA